MSAAKIKEKDREKPDEKTTNNNHKIYKYFCLLIEQIHIRKYFVSCTNTHFILKCIKVKGSDLKLELN